jgi:molecular chaperone GrpE
MTDREKSPDAQAKASETGGGNGATTPADDARDRAHTAGESRDGHAAQPGPDDPSPQGAGMHAEAASAERESAAPEADGAAPDPEASAVESREDQLQRERDDYQDRWLRAMAELENFRKRARRELEDARRFASADVLRSLLDVLDDFERALQALDASAPKPRDLAGFRAGVELIAQRFRNTLTDHGLRPIDAAGELFDPNRHEAIQEIEREGARPGEVVEVVQTGYMMHDMVLRPSRVVVAK